MRTLLTLALALAFGLASAPGLAQNERPQKPETRQAQTLDEQTFNRLNEAQAAIAPEEEGVQPNYRRAQQILDQMLADRENLNEYEVALVWQTYAFLHAEREDYANAIRAFENAIATRGLPIGQELNVQFNLAQLYMAEERYQDAVNTFEAWFRSARANSEDPNNWNAPPNAYVMLASAYAQMERFRDAIPPIRTAIEIAPEPRENWYQLLLAMYFELREYQNAEALLEFMVDRFPGVETYWNQLGAIYGELQREMQSFAVLELNYMQGFLDESNDLERLAQLYMFHEVPYKAGVLLDQEFDEGSVERSEENFEMLANAWFNSREYERALGPLETAAELSDEGDLFYRLGQAQFELQNYREAAAALTSALNKGDLGNRGNVWLLLGITRNNLDDREGAIAAFENAAEFGATRNDANRWINFIRQLEAAGA